MIFTRPQWKSCLVLGAFIIASYGLVVLVHAVFGRLGLSPEPNLEHARCSECNGELEDVSREGVADVAPPHVLATALRFRRCSGCGRVYWPGSHGERILARMDRVASLINRGAESK